MQVYWRNMYFLTIKIMSECKQIQNKCMTTQSKADVALLSEK